MGRIVHRRAVLALALLAATPVGGAEPSPWELPPEGSCATASKLRGWPLGQDAPAIPRRGIERGDPELARSVVWLDLQTLYPLYYASYDAKGEPIDVGYYVGRWSDDRTDYPKDADSSGWRVVDPVGQAFANLRLRASWRRESWQVVSSPESDGKVRQAISLKNLNKGR